jgi:hypothetical protein
LRQHCKDQAVHYWYSQRAKSFIYCKTKESPTIATTEQGDTEPHDLQQAMANPGWKQAMDAKYSALQKNQTWDLVPPMQGINLIDSN